MSHNPRGAIVRTMRLRETETADSGAELSRTVSGPGVVVRIRPDVPGMKPADVPISDPESQHRSSTVCHLANLAVRLGRKLTWDPKSERFIGDDPPVGFAEERTDVAGQFGFDDRQLDVFQRHSATLPAGAGGPLKVRRGAVCTLSVPAAPRPPRSLTAGTRRGCGSGPCGWR